jgi:acyl dehydratase
VEVAGIKKEWEGLAFDTAEFTVDRERMIAFARAAGESDPRFLDPGREDFQAPPTFTAQFVSRRILPESFPRIGSRGFDAGKTVQAHRPVRPGDVLTARSKIHDVYEKTGRSGSMIFIVHRMEFENQDGELVSTVDWRMVRQPDPE